MLRCKLPLHGLLNSLRRPTFNLLPSYLIRFVGLKLPGAMTRMTVSHSPQCTSLKLAGLQYVMLFFHHSRCAHRHQFSSDAGNANNGASDASEANLQIFLDTFVCQANQNGTGYFFFEVCSKLSRIRYHHTNYVNLVQRYVLYTLLRYRSLMSSTKMSLGRMPNLVVLRAGGVYSIPSTWDIDRLFTASHILSFSVVGHSRGFSYLTVC